MKNIFLGVLLLFFISCGSDNDGGLDFGDF